MIGIHPNIKNTLSRSGSFSDCNVPIRVLRNSGSTTPDNYLFSSTHARLLSQPDTIIMIMRPRGLLHSASQGQRSRHESVLPHLPVRRRQHTKTNNANCTKTIHNKFNILQHIFLLVVSFCWIFVTSSARNVVQAVVELIFLSVSYYQQQMFLSKHT